jgi:hypothetical protein
MPAHRPPYAVQNTLSNSLANMSDDEFRALFVRLSKAKWRKMLGGYGR